MTPECTCKRETTYKAICYARRGNHRGIVLHYVTLSGYILMLSCMLVLLQTKW